MRKFVGVLAVFGAGYLLTGCAGDDAAKGVTVSMDEMKYSPSTMNVPAGVQTFTVDNVGSLRHTFSLNALGREVTVAPGKTKTMSITLEPGTYRYVCRVLDHEGLGMRGVLKVRAKQ